MEKQELSKQLKEILPLLKKLIMCNFIVDANTYEDFLQEAQLSAIKALRTFNPEKGFKLDTYVARVVKNDLIQFSKKQFILNDTIKLDDEEVSNAILKSDDDFIEDLEHLERLNQLKRLLSKKEFELVYYLDKGFSFQEIDELMHIKTNNRIQIVSNIRKKLSII